MAKRWLFGGVLAALALSVALSLWAEAATIGQPAPPDGPRPRALPQAQPQPQPQPQAQPQLQPQVEPRAPSQPVARPESGASSRAPATRAAQSRPPAAQAAPAGPAAAPSPIAKPRVVSLDYCADQYVLALAERDQIVALSPHAQSDVSHLGLSAQGIERVRPSAEAVLALAPELVVRQWGGGLGAAETLARYGLPVVQVGVGHTLDAIRASVLELGRALGQPERARRLVDDMDRQVRTLGARHAEQKPVALYVTGGGASAGRGTLIDEMFQIAGVANQLAGRERAGWQTVDLEQIALNPPDLFVTAFFDDRTPGANHWTMGRHPLFARLLESRPTVRLRSDLVACPAWFMLDAAEEVARGSVAPATERALPGPQPPAPSATSAPFTVDPTPASLR